MATSTKKHTQFCPPIEVEPLDFHWWTERPKKEQLSVTVKKDVSIPAIPIRQIPVESQYPYRYCSAGPSQYENLAEQRKARLCMNRIIHDKQIVKKFDVSYVSPKHQYETSTLMASLEPYRVNKANLEITKCHLNKAMLYPKFTRHEIESEFDEYIASQLYPYWKKDTKYKRRLVYKLQPLKTKLDVEP